MAETVKIIGTQDVFVSDWRPRKKRDTRPVREQISDIITGYNCEWDNPRELADRVIKLARKA